MALRVAEKGKNIGGGRGNGALKLDAVGHCHILSHKSQNLLKNCL
jgi:hypothetical protein